MNITGYIKKIMDEKNITAYELSKRSGISQSTFSNLINRGNDPSLETLKNICNGLGIKMSDLMLLYEAEPEADQKKIQDYLVCRELIEQYLKLGRERQECVMKLIRILSNDDVQNS